MGSRAMVLRLAAAREQAAAGVDYSPRFGARCPWCGARVKVYATQPWEGPVRVRYHRCYRQGCALAQMNVSVKSIEVDPVAEAGG
ncbi:hypothetical protein [Desulfofustis limnaeus]|nr:hypothetical protein [Desulfofustis limnaeus]